MEGHKKEEGEFRKGTHLTYLSDPAHRMLRDSISKQRAKTVASGLVDEAKNTTHTGAFGSKTMTGTRRETLNKPLRLP